MHSMGKTLAELHAMLKLNKKGAKGKAKGKNKLAYAPKTKILPPLKRDNPTKESICHHCKEVGQWRRNCLSYHVELKKRKNANVSSTLASRSHKLLKMSGSDKGLEIIQEEDTQSSKNTSKEHNEVAPIEYELYDLDEPHNYKAAFADPESNKWLKAMNTKMQSLKDNQIWYLVDLSSIGELLDANGSSRRRLTWMAIQSSYLEKILKKFKMENSKKGYTPMMEKPDYKKSQGAKTPIKVQRMKRVPYASAIGSIMYAARCTRPDVAFAQNLCSRFEQNPEAEYIATAEASMEAVWIRKFIDGLGGVMPSNKRPIEMLCDNEPSLAIASYPKILKRKWGMSRNEGITHLFIPILKLKGQGDGMRCHGSVLSELEGLGRDQGEDVELFKAMEMYQGACKNIRIVWSKDVLNTMDVEDESGTPSSRGNQEEEHDERINELDEFDEDVDEFIFPEGDKFDIWLKGRVRK
uniref:Retrotransposon protein, putative, Ty1-copia subclass n=1 Tax=Tanacetum cinerariifolium TaxID=118510 RepID=A0A6L2JD19_TANCI|nr:retrotransposon protein, putative, Ty1-copia subclass [Tanacetum cinerariifolium]